MCLCLSVEDVALSKVKRSVRFGGASGDGSLLPGDASSLAV